MISAPTAENPLLVGILVDVSGSMTSAIDNQSGRSQNRLEAFEEALRDLARKAAFERTDTGTSVPIEVFCYAFGFGGPGTILFGSSGPNVRDILRDISGDKAVSLEQIADKWELYDRHVRNLAREMFGSTPMSSAFDAAIQRFRRESDHKVYSGKVLFVLSDGDPTDGTPEDVRAKADLLNSSGVAIVSCYVTSQNITEPRVLYERVGENWPNGARLMFECASQLDIGSAFEGHLKEYGWVFGPGSRIFCQINHTDILHEFMSLITSPIDEKYSDSQERKMNIFVSYAREDATWIPKLEANLKPLSRGGGLELWSDKKIQAGDKWQEQIEKALEQADVAVILVSPDFLASDFIASHELPHMLKSHAARGLRVIPILVRPSRFAQTPELAQFQSLNPPERTLAALKEWEQDQYLVELSNQLATQLVQ